MSPQQGNILVASDKPLVSKHGLGTLDNFATSQPLTNTRAMISPTNTSQNYFTPILPVPLQGGMRS